MALEKTEVQRAECDACGDIQYGEDLGDGIFGFSGTVVRCTPSGGGEGGEWFADREDCIPKAIENVIERSLRLPHATEL